MTGLLLLLDTDGTPLDFGASYVAFPLDLLPDTAGLYERAAAEATSDALPVPIRQIVDPAETPGRFLPWLAVHEGVRLWFSDWPAERRRQIIAEWAELADLIGTRLGLIRLLAYVDAELISAVAHPRRFVLGRSAIGVQPLQFPAFVARYLVKVGLKRHRRGAAAGRAALGRHALVRVELEPLRRVRIAATVAKGPGTQYTATFAHRRRPRFDEMQFGMGFDELIDRTSL